MYILKRYSGYQHSTSFVRNSGPYAVFSSVLQYASDVIVVPCCITFTISTPFLSQKTVAISFVVDNVC
jgi:hypothetical protein